MWKKICLIALLVSPTAAFAASRHHPLPRSVDNDPVMIVYVNADHAGRDANTHLPPEFNPASAQTVQAAQADLCTNPALAAKLRRENVQLRNVVGIETAADGEPIVYVR